MKYNLGEFLPCSKKMRYDGCGHIPRVTDEAHMSVLPATLGSVTSVASVDSDKTNGTHVSVTSPHDTTPIEETQSCRFEMLASITKLCS